MIGLFDMEISNFQNRDTEMSEQRASRSIQRDISSSAPPIEIDKDLPPKYEGLFPDR